MSFTPLDKVKAYVRPEPEDDDLVADLTQAAEDYLLEAGVEPGIAPASTYQLAVKGITLHWYENRNATDNASPDDFEPGIRKVINQLKQSCEISRLSNLGTC